MLRLRHLLTLSLIACALFLRAIVPTGWMPASHGGAFAVEPCPSAGPASMMQMPGPAGHHGEHKADHDCFASALAGGGLPDAPLALAAPSPPSISFKTIFARAGSIGRATALPPPSTGPPALA
jgi:hypothetical protein